jgi:ankyrin repeat protein
MGIVLELCERGANVNAVKTNSGWTALMWASEKSHVGVCKYLLAHGAVKATLSFQGQSAFDLVQEGKNYATLRELLTLARRSSRLKDGE